MSDGLPNDWTDKDQEDLDRSEPESEPSYYDRSWLMDSSDYFTETHPMRGRE